MALVKAGLEVQGLDLNAVWLAKYVPGWPERLRITHTNIEQDPLPFASDSFDLVIFTEVLEHIAVTDPAVILGEIRRVLRRGGRMVLSTPNVANLSNVVAFIHGENVFWPPEIFYGSVDRHNREYTPAELLRLVEKAGFAQHTLGYMNTWSNWHHITGALFHRLLDGSERGERLGRHPLFNNTIFMVATR
jgi:2-polyprenyl-3-methyl-5-hydroxy-6-metoxy-1,4-benzoquinol methylase